MGFLRSTSQTLSSLHSQREEFLSSTPSSSESTSEMETAVLKVVESILLGVQDTIRARASSSSNREQIEEDKGIAAVCCAPLVLLWVSHWMWQCVCMWGECTVCE